MILEVLVLVIIYVYVFKYTITIFWAQPADLVCRQSSTSDVNSTSDLSGGRATFDTLKYTYEERILPSTMIPLWWTTQQAAVYIVAVDVKDFSN